MLGRGVADAPRLVLEDVAQRVHACVGGLDEHHQKPVRTARVHDRVEAAVAVAGGFEVARRLCRPQQSVLAAHRGDVLTAQVRRGELRDLPLEQRGRFDRLAQLALVEHRDPRPGPARELDHPLGLQATQRLADRDDAHAEVGTDLGQDDPIAGAVRAVDDAPADHLVGPLGLRLEHGDARYSPRANDLRAACRGLLDIADREVHDAHIASTMRTTLP